ncbi:MAG: PAS domain S-box protein [Candidatus Fermentibacteraceae bacterium]|nr:PAS domain S-box protein [Candidatus Fermentibacteraceae bacterium]
MILPSKDESLELLMNAPVGIFTTNPEGRLLYANEALAGLFGYESPDDMIESVTDIGSQLYASPGDREEFSRLMRTEGRVKNREYKMTRRDGSQFWASLNARAVEGENGRSILFQGYFSDVSSRRQAEDKFTKIFMAAPNCIAIIRLDDGVIADVNSGFEDITGWKRSEAIGRNSTEMGLWLDPVELDSMTTILRDGSDFINWEFKFRNKAGDLRDGVYSARSILIENEQHYILILQDVTQSKRADESLRLTQFAMDRAPDSILWVDDQGGIIYANQAACSSMGFTQEELLSKKVFEIDPDFPEEGWEQHKVDLQRMGRMRFEGRHRTKEGGIFPVEVTTNYVEYKDRFLGIAFDRDTTERRKAQEEQERLQNRLFQAQKMESLGILAGGVAHDFNNLLQIISGNIEMLLNEKDQDHPDVERLETAARSIDRAGGLVQQLLLFGRKAVVQRMPLNLNHEVNEALQILERTIPKMIRIKRYLADDLWPVSADPIQVEQVLLNLGANSVDAMPGGGELKVKTGNILLDEAHHGDIEDIPNAGYVLLTVSDTGCGMSPDTLNHMYDPFFTTKEAGRGTGLGLASAYGIVKAHGGYIRCQSEPGAGSKFRIYWPALDQTFPLDFPSSRDIAPAGRESILIVDDEQEILRLTKEYLEALGYRILTAEDGEHALETFDQERGKIDIVLLDLNMPGMGGTKCLKQLLEKDPETRVLVASGYMEDSHAHEALTSGAMGFIGKPYQMKELAGKVREILDE